MARQKQKQKRSSTALIAVIIVAVFVTGVGVGAFIVPAKTALPYGPIQLNKKTAVVMGIPAVDTANKGVLGKLTTEVEPGTGKVLVNVINIITLGDTQLSAQKAVRAAANYTRADLSNLDITFNIDVNASTIEGPSAGASMAVSIVFGVRNETPRSDVMITGTIEENGQIGKVGSIFEKAKAAKEGGANVFVVPKGQSTESQTSKTQQCRQMGSTQYCRIIYESKPENIGEMLNMTVVEAANLDEAMGYFRR